MWNKFIRVVVVGNGFFVVFCGLVFGLVILMKHFVSIASGNVSLSIIRIKDNSLLIVGNGLLVFIKLVVSITSSILGVAIVGVKCNTLVLDSNGLLLPIDPAPP